MPIGEWAVQSRDELKDSKELAARKAIQVTALRTSLLCRGCVHREEYGRRLTLGSTGVKVSWEATIEAWKCRARRQDLGKS